MKHNRTRELSVGITLTLALVILAALVMFLSRERTLFHSSRFYKTTTSNSLGLKVGSPVVMGGVQIGTVTAVELPTDVHSSDINLDLSVDKDYSSRIREGSTASLGFITLLSGEKYVGVTPGDPEKPALPGGSMIPPDRAQSLLETGQNMAETLSDTLNELREILVGINRGEGLIGQLVKAQSPYFGQPLVEKAETAFDRTNGLLDRIEKGQGTLGKLLSDRAYADETLGSVKSAAGRMDRILEGIETKKNALGEMVQENGEGAQIIADLRATSSSLKAVSAKLESTTGVLGKILNDREYSEGVAADLKKISASLASIVEKIDQGKGSIGGLVNDPSVYQSLQDVVSGIQKSRTAKFLLRHYGKKGAKARANEPAEPKTAPAPAPAPEGGSSAPPGAPPDSEGAGGNPQSPDAEPASGSDPAKPPQRLCPGSF